jgi:uncharacterized membrane protein YeaQ/YmgE (transglycosylase-associated protein family)
MKKIIPRILAGAIVLTIPAAMITLNFDPDVFVNVLIGIAVVAVVAIIFAVLFSILKAVEEHKETTQAILAYKVVKTKFIDSSHTATSTSRTSTSSAIGRAAVGSMIAGPVGAVVGASTAKQRHTVNEHHTTTFMVYYSDGTHRHETVENNSSKYNLYMSKLEL